MTALDRARVHIFRALDARSMLRADYLYRARDELTAAGFPRWADLAESAALRIGGSDQDMERLLFDLDCECGRREHAA
jgi:hypothetical protein